MKRTILFTVLVFLSLSVSARFVWGFKPVATKVGPNGETLVLCTVENGDTMPMFEMNRLWIYPKRKFRNKRQEKQYWRMVRDVKAALPVVYYIEGVIRQTNDTLMSMPTKKQRDKYMAHFEKRIYKQNYDAMSQLTLRQGMLVMRLLDRDIEQTSYELIKAYRGWFRAGFYQLFAKLCGADLKVKFGDGKNDGVYEEIINLVESGQL
ncbi:MAG: DUF4294 domain-containing protein [Paludibacteraceae bacterium]|nr:DUF4294 domain-containing protein [Paludibacteraceae bacterium]